MISDVALFWLFLAGLLFLDNFVLIPVGGDYLRFGVRGGFQYDAGSRFQARQRDLVLLNPLNPFDRIVLTRHCAGPVNPSQWRVSRRDVQASLPANNKLAALGSAYLLTLIVLAAASLKLYFGVVLLVLACSHILTWVLALTILLRNRKLLRLDKVRVVSLALEAFFVPGYLVNLGKRIWFKRRFELAGLTVGLRQLKRMPEGDVRELYHMRLAQRLSEMADDLGIDEFAESNNSAGPTQSAAWSDSVDASPLVGRKDAEFGCSALELWFRQAKQCVERSAPL